MADHTNVDGLLDGKALLTSSGKKVGPTDPDPMMCNGPKGIWTSQLAQEESGTIPTELGDWYEYEIDWSSLDGGMHSPAAIWLGNLLCFRLDSQGTVFHSQTRNDINEYLTKIYNDNAKLIPDFLYNPNEKFDLPIDTWQKPGGYGDLYDEIFSAATDGNMRREKFQFKYDGEEYIIWTWRGNYLNIGSGAETGIYTNPHNVAVINREVWDAVDFTLPMTLNLYNYSGKDKITKIFCWAPNEKQWWITGFNPDFEPVAKNMVSLGTIDFAGREDMFRALKDTVEGEAELKDFMIFDEDGHTVWLIWWEK